MRLRELNPDLRLRIAVGFVQRLVDSMITAVVAINVAARVGVGAAGGLLVAVMSLAVVGTLVGGHLAHVRGRRPTLFLGEVAGAVGFAVMALAEAGRPPGADVAFLAAFALSKVGAGLAMPANEAMIIDLSTPENRKTVYTINYWAINLALAVGALLGGFLYGSHFAALLAAAAAAMGVVALTTVLILSETKPAAEPVGAAAPRPDGSVRAYLRVLGDGVFARFVLAATLISTLEFQLLNWVGIRLSLDFPTQTLLPDSRWQLEVDGVAMLGLLRAENTLLVVLLAFVLAGALRRIDDSVRMRVGITLFTTGYVVYAVSNDIWVLLAAGAVVTIGELLDVPARQALLAGLVPETARPRYMAVYTLRIRLALVAAAACVSVGSVVPNWGMAILYALLGAIILGLYQTLWAAARAISGPASGPAPDPAPGAVSVSRADPGKRG